MYKAKIEKNREKLLDYDNNSSRVCTTIWLNCEKCPQIHIEGMESLHEIWSILKNQSKSLDLATQNNVISQMIYQTQSDFSTITKYGEVFKKGTTK